MGFMPLCALGERSHYNEPVTMHVTPGLTQFLFHRYYFPCHCLSPSKKITFLEIYFEKKSSFFKFLDQLYIIVHVLWFSGYLPWLFLVRMLEFLVLAGYGVK
jgi:hypothetical protein